MIINYPTNTQARFLDHVDEVKIIMPNDHIIGVFLQGSQNYHLDTPQSDVDTKAIITPSFDDIAAGAQLKSLTHIRSNNEHIDFKDVRALVKEIKKGNVNSLEILWTNYFFINEKYSPWYELIENREAIAHYNPVQTVRMMYGTAQHYYAMIKHISPTTEKIIKEKGYNPKALANLLRVNDFISRYMAGESFGKAIIPYDAETLTNVVKAGLLTLNDVEWLMTKTINDLKNTVDSYINNNKSTVNKDIETLLTDISKKLITIGIQSELIF